MAGPTERVRAWRPSVPGVAEVLHALPPYVSHDGRAASHRGGQAGAVRRRALAARGVDRRRRPLAVAGRPRARVRVFRREYGLPPHRYVVGRRLGRARWLLLEGLPIAEVAVACGFHDQPHLARHFRALLGTTPGAFRSAA